AGELAPEDPGEGSGAPAGRPGRGKQVGHIEAPQSVHATCPDSLGGPSGMAKLSAEEPDALMHARPGPWEPWRVTARATQPDARNAPHSTVTSSTFDHDRHAFDRGSCLRGNERN